MLPFVPLLDVHASDAPPKRLLLFFTSNGTIYDSWLPSMVDGELSLSPILAPLEKLKSKILVVDGLMHTVIMEKGERSGHSAGMNTALTGWKAKSIDPTHPLRSLGTGISIDQYLAPKIGADTKFPTLEAGIQVQPFSTDNSSLSYRGPLQPISADNSPYTIFDRVFRGFDSANTAEDPAALARTEDRKRVLEAVRMNLDRVSSTLPQADRIKMDAHIGAVEAIEHSLSTGVGAAAANACALPDLGPRIDVWNNKNIPAIARLQMDLMVMALACDLTRIGTLQFGRAGAAHRFTWLGKEFEVDPGLAVTDQATGFHALAHKESEPVSRAKIVRINTWYAEQFAYLLDKLASIPERGGTMLDNTVVVWFNELGNGGTHSHDKTPWVIGGNAGKFFKPGNLASFDGEPHNRLLISLLHSMGVPDETFGDPDFCHAGALTGISV